MSNNTESVRLSDSDSEYNLKIMSWNVDGLQVLVKNNGLNAIHSENADIVCLQDIKCAQKDIPEELKLWTKYNYKYYSKTTTKGFSGVCLLSKEKPISVAFGIGIKEHDSEGRVITAEFNEYYVITIYAPNSGRKLIHLEYRQRWDKDLRVYIKKINAIKPVILCGNLNVSHKQIDLEMPEINTKTAGFTPQERDGFTQLLGEGFIDAFRETHPELKKCYTFWSHNRNARQRDIGWRIDYFLVSIRLKHTLKESRIAKQITGSDHCPILLFLKI